MINNHLVHDVSSARRFAARPRLILAALSMGAFLATSPASAQDGMQDEESEGFLEEIIVTGTPRGVSKMESSLSITTVSSDRAQNFVPQGTVDILRSIPGIRAESTGGDSNGNITVRGVPLGGGGSKFLQLHEDGLPVLQFGDIIVGNADNYYTYDNTVKRVEAVKGSTAATLASNSPSGIINFVSKTGEEEGGSFAYTVGLDYDSDRIDFDYGQPVGDDWAFHIGGFYRQGEGVRDIGFDAEDGGQIKLSVTRFLDNGKFRIYGKILDDRTATILPMPVTLSNGALPGLDPRSASNIPAGLTANTSTSGDGGIRRSNIADGNGVKSQVIGGELSLDVTDTLTLTERFRAAKNSGSFFGAFSVGVGDATDPFSAIGGRGGPYENAFTLDALVTNADQLTLGYASGVGSDVPLTQQELSNLNGNGLIQEIRTFDNDINSLDNFTNDLSLTMDFGNADLTVGYYSARQEIDIDWYWQAHIADVADEPRLLDLFSDTTRLTSNGQTAFGAPVWGNCCTRDTYIDTSLSAVYAALNWQASDNLSVNASVRYDDGEGNGSWISGTVNAIDLDDDGVISFAEANAETITVANRVNKQFAYDWSYTSFALGANWEINDDWAVFGNISEGGRANVDRLADAGFIIDGQAQPGSVENTVSMFEVGVKREADSYGIFATAFFVETDDVNSEAARGLDTPARVREFESTGLEVEVVANIGDISVFGGLTYTDTEIVGSNDPTVIGNTPRRQPDFVYTATVAYNFNEHRFGLSMFGRDDSFVGDDNSNKLDGYTSFNLFADLALSDRLGLRLAVNNVSDEIGLTEAEGGFQSINGFDIIRARSITGRSSSLQLKYHF